MLIDASMIKVLIDQLEEDLEWVSFERTRLAEVQATRQAQLAVWHAVLFNLEAESSVARVPELVKKLIDSVDKADGVSRILMSLHHHRRTPDVLADTSTLPEPLSPPIRYKRKTGVVAITELTQLQKTVLIKLAAKPQNVDTVARSIMLSETDSEGQLRSKQWSHHINKCGESLDQLVDRKVIKCSREGIYTLTIRIPGINTEEDIA